MPERTAPSAIDDYIGRFPPQVQKLLRSLRRAIKRAAPDAQDSISYKIPAFGLGGKKLVWFAAFKNHIGFYPGVAAIVLFEKELAPYEGGRGSVRFPFDRPLPLALIGRVVKHRFGAHRTTARAKRK